MRRTAITTHHPCATCAMGTGEGAVLDRGNPRCRRLGHARSGLGQHQRLRADDRGESGRPGARQAAAARQWIVIRAFLAFKGSSMGTNQFRGYR
ncbi:MAG: hypothetical protein ACRELS_06090 [Candidatus Rokuibacteriota bacterium]